jgi:type IV secretory pathway VirJ component
VDRLAGLHVLCFYGVDEKDSLCPQLPPTLVTPIRLEGGHHFDGAYIPIARRILEAAEPPATSETPSPPEDAPPPP